MWDFSHELSLRLAFFLTFGAKTRNRVEFLALTLLSWLSSRIWAALPGPLILESATLSLAYREGLPLQHASKHHPPPANLPLRSALPLWVLLACWAVVSLSHFLKNSSASLLSSRELGSPLGTVNNPVVKMFPLGVVLHISLSLLRTWYFGNTHNISPQVRPSPWELDLPNSFRLPNGISAGQPWAPPPNDWS
jgi:hypothetical protein